MINKIRNILETNNFNEFLGLKEDDFFEAKGKDAYDLNLAKDRYELVKDVSSFANNKGGYLIIGLKTMPLVEENTDNVTTFDLFENNQVDIEKVKGVIKDNIFPKIKDLNIFWVESLENKKKGIIVIYIPEQNESDKFFIIKNLVEDG